MACLVLRRRIQGFEIKCLIFSISTIVLFYILGTSHNTSYKFVIDRTFYDRFTNSSNSSISFMRYLENLIDYSSSQQNSSKIILPFTDENNNNLSFIGITESVISVIDTNNVSNKPNKPNTPENKRRNNEIIPWKAPKMIAKHRMEKIKKRKADKRLKNRKLKNSKNKKVAKPTPIKTKSLPQRVDPKRKKNYALDVIIKFDQNWVS